MKHTDGIELVDVQSRAQWRRWLLKNHSKYKAVWLIYNKPGSGKKRVSYPDAVEEALCFGWIDSKPNVLDEFRTIQFFSQRKPSSGWSKINKQRIEKLERENKLHPSGIAVIEIAKKNGTWESLDKIEALEIPVDLQKALARNKKAATFFEAFPPSSKKIILHWIHSAKMEATRKKRIAETVTLAALNKRANHYEKRKKQEVSIQGA